MASQAALRDAFVKKHPNLRYGLNSWRQYEGGIWASVDIHVVNKYVQEIIPRSDLTNSLVNAVVSLLESFRKIPSELFDWNSNVLTFKNCCLDLTTYKEVPHSSDYYATDRLNFDYDPTARSAAWDEVVKSFPYVDVLQRFAGLALTTETKYEVALWLYGPPGGGKSTFITGLEAMLGSRTCVLGLDEIGRSNFALSQIPGKTLAVSTEQPAGFVKCSHKLNALISGESVTIDQKFKPQFTILPKIKLLWAMNDLPMIPAGAGAGLFRRVYPIHWAGRSGTEMKPGLKEEIAHSGMAVVNWALEGLKRLRARAHFDIPPALMAARDAYREQSDMTLCFLNDCCDVDAKAEVEGSKLYEEYDKWATKNGHRPLASNRFAVDLQRLGYEKTRRSIGVFWFGIDLKQDFPEVIFNDQQS